MESDTLAAVLLVFSEHKKHFLTAGWIFFSINSWMQIEHVLDLRAKRKIHEKQLKDAEKAEKPEPRD